MTLFLDTTVFMYAGGGEHPLRPPCRTILQRVIDGDLEATTSVEVVQEILHRYRSIRRDSIGIVMASATLDALAPVLPVTHATLRQVTALAERYPALATRDLVHIATCVFEGIQSIVTSDRGFDAVREIRRVDPLELGGA